MAYGERVAKTQLFFNVILCLVFPAHQCGGHQWTSITIIVMVCPARWHKLTLVSSFLVRLSVLNLRLEPVGERNYSDWQCHLQPLTKRLLLRSWCDEIDCDIIFGPDLPTPFEMYNQGKIDFCCVSFRDTVPFVASAAFIFDWQLII